MSSIKERYINYQNTLTDLEETVQTVKAQFFNAQRLFYEPQVIDSGLPYTVDRDGVFEPKEKAVRDVDGSFGDFSMVPVDKGGLEIERDDPRLGIFKDLKQKWQTLVAKPLDALSRYKREHEELLHTVKTIESGTVTLLSNYRDDDPEKFEKATKVLQTQLDTVSGQLVFEDSNTQKSKDLRILEDERMYALSFVQELKEREFNATTPSVVEDSFSI